MPRFWLVSSDEEARRVSEILRRRCERLIAVLATVPLADNDLQSEFALEVAVRAADWCDAPSTKPTTELAQVLATCAHMCGTAIGDSEALDWARRIQDIPETTPQALRRLRHWSDESAPREEWTAGPRWILLDNGDQTFVVELLRRRFGSDYDRLNRALDLSDPLDIYYPGNPDEYSDVALEFLCRLSASGSLREVEDDVFSHHLGAAFSSCFDEIPTVLDLVSVASAIRTQLGTSYSA